jgi:hypothetical protein
MTGRGPTAHGTESSTGQNRRPLADQPAPYQHPAIGKHEEAVVAKGQTRTVKEKKKPKADKDKPKQMSAYKASQMSGTSTASGKK